MKRHLILAFLLLVTAISHAQTKPPARYEISGTVVDALRNQPLANADIQILSIKDDLVQRMQTSTDGVFRFTGLAPAKYQLIGNRHGYLRQGLNQHEFYFTGVAVGSGKPSTGIVFRLQPEAVISGRVVDTFGDPVPDASVMLFFHGLWNGAIVTTHETDVATDDQGFYRFDKLEPGTYLVAVSAKPWYAVHLAKPFASTPAGRQLDVAYPTTFYDAVTEPESASPIVVRAGDDVAANFTLAAVPAARVVIHSANVGAVSGFEPVLGGHENEVETHFDEQPIDEHTFELAGLPPGPLRLDARDYSVEDAQPHSIVLNLAAGDSVDAGDLSDAPVTRSLHITLQSDTQGTSSQNNNFYLRDRSTGHTYTEQVTPDGSAWFRELPAGSYDFAIASFNGYLGRVTATGARVSGHTIELGDDSAQLNIELKHDGPDVPGIVLDGKTPHAGAMVLLVPESDPIDLSSVRRDQSDSDGTFTFHSVGPGRYTAVAIENGWDLEWTRREVLAPYLPKGEHIEVKPNDKVHVTLLLQQ